MEICVSTFLCSQEELLKVLPVFAENDIKNLEVWTAFSYGNKNHFPYWELDFAPKLRQELLRLGIQTPIMHAPFNDELDISRLDEADRQEAVREIEEAMAVFSQLPAASIVVIHPGGLIEKPEEEKAQLSQSLKSLKELTTYAARRNLHLAVENMLPGRVACQPAAFSFLWEELPQTGLCLDTGHAYIAGVFKEFLERFREKIFTYHLSDTYDEQDRHLLPFEGKVDWNYFQKTALNTHKPPFLTFETRQRGELKEALNEIKKTFARLTTT